MPLSFTPSIQNYVDASNAHDVNSILACFADDAVVGDENATHRGKIEIERWVRNPGRSLAARLGIERVEAVGHEREPI